VNLKFCQINAENLFLLIDQELPVNFLNFDETQWQKLSTSVYSNKPLKHLIKLADALKDIDADIFMLNEVGGYESLKNFNDSFLNNRYTPILTEGNSDRNIDVGFLIKKELPFYFDLFSHKNKELNLKYNHELITTQNKMIYKFSRDCAELRLFKNDVQNPFIIILLTHLKSPLDPDRVDSSGFLRRSAELKACLEIYDSLQKQFPQCGFIVAGDFNGQASSIKTDPEFLGIYESTDLKDILDLAGLPENDRHTFIQVKSGLRAEGRQIDYCFLSKNLQNKLNLKLSQVYLYKDQFGSPLKKPETMNQKQELPSDHYPLIFTLENIQI
jgi:endonuclease/exonuclease/phosphatase family metal-dependent hydrolase